jgi:ATP-dependent helicase/nuclease subunit A
MVCQENTIAKNVITAHSMRDNTHVSESLKMSHMDILSKNLLVLASAGSGKTFCLSDRIIGLMARGAEPEQIVALTFTRKAAGEFADAILNKLADAATDQTKAKELLTRFKASDTDFTALLEKTVSRLPKLTLGTMDSFFSKIVKAFQYDLGVSGGIFELLEGEQADLVRDELMESLLEAGTTPDAEDDFVEIFRKATAGQEGVQVIDDLRKFIRNWHELFASPIQLEWGPAHLAGVEPEDWNNRKEALIESIRRDWVNVKITHGSQQKSFEKMMEMLDVHTIGSGSMNKPNSLLQGVMDAVACGDEGAMKVKCHKDMDITGIAAQKLRELLQLAARCEFAAALSRTRGIHQVIAAYDALIGRELRAKGKLGFGDVKRLMGEWLLNEDSRLMREQVDFRLDARHHHWLLDEFQDTSRDDWNGLFPLIDEGISDDKSTVFIVGDKKQAIYAWRGGEVGLFDEVQRHYKAGTGIEVASMAESWRSCPEVLNLVNKVCGGMPTMLELFGDVANEWPWEHHVSTDKLSASTNSGHARVEIISKDEKTGRVIHLLHELGIGEKKISCGILVPRNEDVREWADALRSEEFQVIEEGVREPAKDHPAGVMIWQLLNWLADPSDSLARMVVMMSPMATVLQARFGESWQDIWNGVSRMISENGFSPTVRSLAEPLMANWQDFGKRRIDDLLMALNKIDQEGIVLAREAAARIGKMKISQSPGVASVQVMTIHKSKGLGFDVVILPDVPDVIIPSKTHLKSLMGDGWLTETPADWVRKIIPELSQAEAAWSRQQCYDAFCKLYVSLTRAKRGLYVFLDQKKPNDKEAERATLTNWMTLSLDLIRAEAGSYFESGSADWHQAIGPIERPEEPSFAALGLAISKRPRTTPSSGKTTFISGGGTGRLFGNAVHKALEQITWLDEAPLPEFQDEIQKLLENTLVIPDIRALLSKTNRHIDLFREQKIEAVHDGKWLSGAIDRLHLHRDASGNVPLVEIIDFKTDKIATAEELRLRYTSQIEAYRNTMQAIYPSAEIRCHLISTALGVVV